MNRAKSPSVHYLRKLHQSANFLKRYLGQAEIAVVLGSGFAEVAAELKQSFTLSYTDIPNFFVPSAPGHQGRAIVGKFGTMRVLFLCGRVHCYEGYSAAEVAFAVRALGLAGVRKLVVTNAAGGVNPRFKVGDLMLIDNQLSFFCEDPCRGLKLHELGEYFYDCSYPYDLGWLKRVKAKGDKDLKLRQGVYAMTAGPRFESAAEVKALAKMGADAVGMSTVPEVLAARQMGVKVLGVSLISNLAAGISKTKLNSQEVLDEGKRSIPRISAALRTVLEVS